LIGVLPDKREPFRCRHVGNPDHECVRVELSLDLAHIRPQLGADGTRNVMNLNDRGHPPTDVSQIVEALIPSPLHHDDAGDGEEHPRGDDGADEDTASPSLFPPGRPRFRPALLPVWGTAAGACILFSCHTSRKDRF